MENRISSYKFSCLYLKAQTSKVGKLFQVNIFDAVAYLRHEDEYFKLILIRWFHMWKW